MNTEKVTQFILSVIKRTLNNDLKWDAKSPTQKDLSDAQPIIGKVYTLTITRTQQLRIYKYRYKMQIDEYEWIWREKIKLELTDLSGVVEYEFDYQNSIYDLYEIVREYTSKINDVMDSFISED